jgi:hypothetical protein
MGWGRNSEYSKSEEERIAEDARFNHAYRQGLVEQQRQEEERIRNLPRLTKMSNARTTCRGACGYTPEEFGTHVLERWRSGPNQWSLTDYLPVAWSVLQDPEATSEERRGAAVIAAAALNGLGVLAEAARSVTPAEEPAGTREPEPVAKRRGLLGRLLKS